MKRQERLGMRVRPQDKLQWKDAAKSEGKSLSAWIEHKLNEAVKDES